MGIGTKAKRPGVRRPLAETYSGPSYCRDLGKLVHKDTVVDRENNDYLEHIEDPETGRILHHCHEPLSMHVGHGSAKGND